MLRSNFALVGEVQEEEGEGEEEEEEGEGDGKLIKESDDVYTVWASGRINCDNFLAQLKVYTYIHTVLIISKNVQLVRLLLIKNFF